MMQQPMKRLLITGGGSGGHIFPGLAVANYLIRNNGWKVCWLGSYGNLEEDIVPKNGIEIKCIHALGFSGKDWCKRLQSVLHLCISTLKARSILRDWNPDIVFGVGGYVSVAVGIAAWVHGYPMIIHEQNSIAGFANRFLSTVVANKVLQAFPGAFSCAETVGNPIRDIILSIENPESRLYRRIGPIRLLVIGGSQGAQIFNDMFPKILLESSDRFIIWHQVGKGNFEKVRCAYGISIKNVYKLMEFIDDIATAYSWADIVICRAGALTVSEISSVGLAAIFVPFIHKDYHQYWNAFPLQQVGAAKIIKESEFTVFRILQILYSWSNRVFLVKMAKRAKMLSVSDATKKIACHIITQVLN